MARKNIPNFPQRVSPMKIKTRMLTEAEILKIKDEATQKAVEKLQSQFNPELERAKGYNDAITDVQRYFVICGCRVLHDTFGFGRKRIERFIDNLVNSDGDLKGLEQWLKDDMGMKLELTDADLRK